MKLNNRKKLIISICAVLSIILIGFGFTMAFFNYSKEGNTVNTIHFGELTFHYDEISGKGRGINLIDALPVDSDDDAKSSNDYFDFRITSSPVIAQIPYTITARLKEDSNLDNSVVKIYLTKVIGNSETEVLYTTLDQLEARNFLGGYTDKVLYRETVPVNGNSYDVHYRLRMWIAEGVDFSDEAFNNKHLTITINVYTMDGSDITESNRTTKDDTRLKMVAVNNTYVLDESDESNVDYDVNVPNDVDDIDFDVMTQNIAAESTVTPLGQTLAYTDGIILRRINASNSYPLLVGDNYFRIDVLSADKEVTNNYIIDVKREPSKDNNLTYLAVENYAFTEEFDKDVTTYHVSNAVEASSINIVGNKSSDVASITGTGTKNLSWGENTFTVTVTPEDPNTEAKVYTIIVNNQKPTAPGIGGGTGDTWTSTTSTVSILSPGTAISGVNHYEYYKTLDPSEIVGSETVPTGTITVDPYSLEISDSGITYIYYRSVSNLGNKSEWSNSVTVRIDDMGPTTPTSGTIGDVAGTNTTGTIQTVASGSQDIGIGGITYKYMITNTNTMPDKNSLDFTTDLTFNRSCGTSYYGWAIAEDEFGNRSDVYSLGSTSDGVDSYSDWGTCSKTCGSGTQERTNTCALVTEDLSQTCNTQACCYYETGYNHKLGDSLSYGGLNWYVLSDNGSTLTLVLKGNYTTGAYGSSTAFASSNAKTLLNTNFVNAYSGIKNSINADQLVIQSSTNTYVRLLTQAEVQSYGSKITNTSGTPYWTMTASGSNMWYAQSNGALTYSNGTCRSGTYYSYSDASYSNDGDWCYKVSRRTITGYTASNANASTVAAPNSTTLTTSRSASVSGCRSYVTSCSSSNVDSKCGEETNINYNCSSSSVCTGCSAPATTGAAGIRPVITVKACHLN